jgi:hypothetical protein
MLNWKRGVLLAYGKHVGQEITSTALRIATTVTTNNTEYSALHLFRFKVDISLCTRAIHYLFTAPLLQRRQEKSICIEVWRS